MPSEASCPWLAAELDAAPALAASADMGLAEEREEKEERERITARSRSILERGGEWQVKNSISIRRGGYLSAYMHPHLQQDKAVKGRTTKVLLSHM